MISVSIATGHGNDRKIITSLLAEHNDFRIASVGIDGYDALKSAKIYRPNIIIMDFCLKDIDSPALAPIIKRHSPLTKLIVICSHAGHCALGKVLNKAISAGISGYLLKESDFEDLASSVRSVFYGGLYIGNPIKCHALNFFNSLELSDQSGKDTLHQSCDNIKQYFKQTELQIINGIALGNEDEKIAKELNISKGTLRNKVYRMKKNTGLKNRSQITVYTLIEGMLDSDKILEQFMK